MHKLPFASKSTGGADAAPAALLGHLPEGRVPAGGTRVLWSRVAFPLALAGVLAVFFMQRATRGFEYPAPWPDEGSFLWQAINFAERGTLFTPELNPDRHVLWMPPGYMITVGSVFAVTGFSFALARLLSGIFLAGAIVCVAFTLRRSPLRVAHVFVLGLFLLSPIAQLAGNTARMEPLVVLVAAIGFAALSEGAVLVGLCLVGLSPLIHPNGLFPAAGAAALVLAGRVRSGAWPEVRRWELAAVLGLVLAWASYFTYAALHAESWLEDMGGQLRWKQAESALAGGLGRVLRFEALLLMAGWFGAFRLGARRLAVSSRGAARGHTSQATLLALSGSFVVQTLVTTGWLYDLYAAFAFAVLLCISLELFAERTEALEPSGRRRAAWAAATAGAALLALGVPRLPSFTRSVAVAAVSAPGAAPYVTHEDLVSMRWALKQLAAWHGPLVIQFLPEADALLFADLRSERIRFLQQTHYDALPDLYVHHTSVWIPEVAGKMVAARVAFQHGVRMPISKWPLVRARGATERWQVYRR
jgi:hypothetical protein